MSESAIEIPAVIAVNDVDTYQPRRWRADLLHDRDIVYGARFRRRVRVWKGTRPFFPRQGKFLPSPLACGLEVKARGPGESRSA